MILVVVEAGMSRAYFRFNDRPKAMESVRKAVSLGFTVSFLVTADCDDSKIAKC